MRQTRKRVRQQSGRTVFRRLLVFGVLVAVLVSGCGCGARQQTIVFREHLDDTVLKLDGESYALRELAFYVAYEEQMIQEQALLYDSKSPRKYWNTHMNGHFTSVRARQEAMNFAIHDFIFYEMAQETGMELTDEEIDYAQSKADDFWMDLEERGQQRLGVAQDELTEDMLRMALAQKYQELYAMMEDVPVEDFDIDGDAYAALLEEHTYKIKTNIWEGISMGSVTVSSH